MTNKEKILSCYGNLNAKSTAKMIGCKISSVYTFWWEAGKRHQPKYTREY